MRRLGRSATVAFGSKYMVHRRPVELCLSAVVMFALLAACGGQDAGQRPTGVEQKTRSTPTRIVAAVMLEPPALYRPLIPGAFSIQVADLVDSVVHASLTAEDDRDLKQPALAEAVPSLDNGLWRLLPSGQMELQWKIREGAQWHDGTPLTADDLVFTLQVSQDPALPELRARDGTAFELIERIVAVDLHTVLVTWKAPFIRADGLFSNGLEGYAAPLPRHILEGTHAESRDAFLQVPYWTREFVGLGPYKLREWVPGSHLLVGANDAYILGRPKIDEIEVRFVLDASTLSSNLLAGAVDITLGTGMSLEESLAVRDQWRDGRLEATSVNYWLVIYPQFSSPSPPIITDVRFRRALLQAIDRQTIADELQAGLVLIAHSYVRPGDLSYGDLTSQVVRYDYNPQRAGQVLEELGYVRDAERILRDASGQRLTLEVRATTSPVIHTKTMFPVADYWQRLGIAAEPLVVPIQRSNDLEYTANFPSFFVVRQPLGSANLDRFRGSEARLPPRYNGRNQSRYNSPELEELIDRLLVTIPRDGRTQVMGQIVHHVSNELNAMGLFYDVRTMLVSNRLENVPVENSAWNIHLWNLKS
jgi:peptide/nickel transport system substrate-binding protein